VFDRNDDLFTPDPLFCSEEFRQGVGCQYFQEKKNKPTKYTRLLFKEMA